MASPQRPQRGRAVTEPVHHSDHPPLPAPPDPSKDPGVVPSITTPPEDDGTIPEEIDIFTLTPVAALKMLCGSVEALVRMTGDVPPTPPLHLSEANVQALFTEKDGQQRARFTTPEPTSTSDHIDGVPFVKTPIGSPETHTSDPLHDIGANAQPVYLQHGAIARRFYSKKPPPISLEEYLLRLHRYCPMSTGVYLATALYIHNLAMIERVLSVTPRNVHRLVLAGLRIAMKALEDLSYPHRRFAKVGGVSEVELGRLEIAFCFLTNFELKVDAEMLLKEARGLRNGSSIPNSPVAIQPKLSPMREKGKDGSKRKSAPPMMQQVMPVRGFAVDVETPS